MSCRLQKKGLRRITAQTRALCQDGVGLTMCILKEEGGPVYQTGRCVSAGDGGGALPPGPERMAEDLDRTAEGRQGPEIWAGNGGTAGGLRKWIANGVLGSQSAVSSEVVRWIQGLLGWLLE